MLNFVIRNIILIFLILFPVFYLPVTSESYEYNKMALLVIFVCTLTILYVIRIAKKKLVRRVSSSFTWLLIILAGITLISTLFQSANQVLALTTPLSASTIIASVLFYLLLMQAASEEQIAKLLQILVFEAVIIAVFVILTFAHILPDSSFTPAGTLLSTFSFLSTISVFLIAQICVKLMDRNLNLGYKISSAVPGFLALISIFGTSIFLLFQLATVKKPLLLPISYGWLIFLETLKSIRTLVLGVGPTNFITAFTLTKPFSFNATPHWNVIFTQSSSFLLNLATEAGILSGLIYLFILFKSIRLLKTSSSCNFPYRISLIYTLLLQVILPSGMALFILTAILLFLAGEKIKKPDFTFAKSGVFSYVFAAPAILLCGLLIFFSGKFYLAEVYFKKSLDSLLNKEGTAVYQYQDTAIKLNPHLDRYRVAFSQTNLALANNLAAKRDLTVVDKQTIPNLVKQAIDEARTAVILNRTNEMNWDNLARVYSGLIGYAQGSESWSEYSFRQKLALDPLNPNAYIALSSLYLSQNNAAQAENMARRAVTVKPDLANAYYYLNLSLQGQKKYKEAYEELKKSYYLLKPDSADGRKISGEMEVLAKLIPEKASGPSAQVNPVPDQVQNLDLAPATSSALLSLPDTLPTISLPQPPQ